MNRTSRKKAHFVSLRWRLVIPLAIVLAMAVMVGTYWIAWGYTASLAVSEEQRLLQGSQAVMARTSELYITQRTEAQRIAYTEGLAAFLQAGDIDGLQTMLGTLARTGQLDSVLILNMNGIEIAGLLYSAQADSFAFNSGSDLSDQSMIQRLMTGTTEAAGLFQTSEGLVAYVGVPLLDNGEQIGAILVGLRMETLLARMKASAIVDVTLYDSDGLVLQTTIPLANDVPDQLTTPRAVINQALAENQPIIGRLQIADVSLRGIYTPFVYGQSALGVVATTMVDSVPIVANSGRQAAAIFLAVLAGLVVLVVVLLVNWRIAQLTDIRRAAQALARGHLDTRTGLQSVDEVGAVGQALDEIATATQLQHDRFTAALHREREDRQYLATVLDTISDGVVLFNAQHQLILMNQVARGYVPDANALARIENFLRQVASHPRSYAIAPGLDMLGEAHALMLGQHRLQAQVAEVTAAHGHIGRAVILQNSARSPKQAEDNDVAKVDKNTAQKYARHAAALQQLITHMRAITENTMHTTPKRDSIHAEVLLIAVANDWRQIARAADLEMRLQFKVRGYHLAGDEQLLRRALGNLVDNAIKYTPQGGAVALEILEEIKGKLYMRVRDNGVGVAKEDIPHLFKPFYRGTPTTETGDILRVPGLGEGLTQAHQIIRQHGGSMKVKSRVGVGTAIYFSLPTAQTDGSLPTFDDDAMDGETVGLPEGGSVEDYWDRLGKL